MRKINSVGNVMRLKIIRLRNLRMAKITLPKVMKKLHGLQVMMCEHPSAPRFLEVWHGMYNILLRWTNLVHAVMK